MIRKADRSDVEAVAAIYERIHAAEAAGHMVTGWLRGIYPIRATAEAAVGRGDLFVLEEDGTVRAAAIINQTQVDAYALCPWADAAPPEQVMVLHTLTVDPLAARRGYGRTFVAFYEDYARANDCPCLRMDTNARNAAARALYKKLGYREAGIVPCTFNGIPGVQLVCLEKKLD